MRMINLGEPLHTNIMDTATAVDCGRELRLRRSFRSLVECMVPCCTFQPSSTPGGAKNDDDDNDSASTDTDYSVSTGLCNINITTTTSSTVTGTFFGHRKGRVSFCLQEDRRSTPVLLLDLAIPTACLASEMQGGLLRIALEYCNNNSSNWCKQVERCCSLYNVPVWSMYCNGRKVGFAMRRQMNLNDAAVLRLTQSVSVGAGVLPLQLSKSQHDSSLSFPDELIVMYLRASFQRVIGSPDSQSFHIINPTGSSAQELSIFLLRS